MARPIAIGQEPKEHPGRARGDQDIARQLASMLGLSIIEVEIDTSETEVMHKLSAAPLAYVAMAIDTASAVAVSEVRPADSRRLYLVAAAKSTVRILLFT